MAFVPMRLFSFVVERYWKAFLSENKADVKQVNLCTPPLFQRWQPDVSLGTPYPVFHPLSQISSLLSGGAFRGHFTRTRVWVSGVAKGLASKIYS